MNLVSYGIVPEKEDREKCLAYLEKQKELPTNEEMLRTLRVEYEKGVADTIAKYENKEPQSAEWNDEDEELAEELIKLAEYYTDTEDETEFKPHISWLKTLPERFGLQPKQEHLTDVELEEEIVRWLSEGDITDTRFDDYGDSDIESTARHFAKWGAAHPNIRKEESK